MLAQTVKTIDGPLAIEEKHYGDEVLVVSLEGELDAAVVPTARRRLETALAGPCRLVVVDLGDLTFLDSAGVALLYRLAESRPDPDTLRLLPGRNPGVTRILARTGVGSVLRIVADGRERAGGYP